MLSTGDRMRQARHLAPHPRAILEAAGRPPDIQHGKDQTARRMGSLTPQCPVRGERSRQQDTEATQRLLQAPWSLAAHPLDGMAPSGNLTAAGPVGLLPAARPV